MSATATEARYELTLTQADGNENVIASSHDLSLLLRLRDEGTKRRRSNGERSFCYRVLDSNDYERGVVEWPEDA